MRALCVGALALVASLQPVVSPGPAPDTLVRVDAFVADARGRAIETLKPSDFDLREDGVPQTIEGMRFVRAAGRSTGPVSAAPVISDADEQREASRPGVRLFAIYLDEYHITPGAAADRARAAIGRFITDELGPHDLLVVMKPLDSLFAIHLTYDRDAARKTLEAFEGRLGDYTSKNAYEREYMASTPAAMDRMRMQVTLSALNSLAVHLGWASHDARKTLIIVSEGFSAAVRRRGTALPTMEQVVRSANRSNVSIYPIDPGAPMADETSGADALAGAAAQTDGWPVPKRANLDAELRRIAADSSGYYLIIYRSPGRTDNKFHEVQLRVKRRGAVVRTRGGYWALSPDDLLRAEVLARMNAPTPVVPREPAPHNSPLIRPWFGMARGAEGKTRVTFVWEPAVRVPGDRSRHQAARLTLTVLAGDGQSVFDGAVLPSGPGTFDAGEDTPPRAVFDVAPGRVRIRMSIEDPSLQAIDSDVRTINVRDLHDRRDPVVLGTPEVMRARNAREFREINSDPEAAPVAAREFSRTERLVIRVPAYAADAALSVSATLMNRTGQEMRSLTVKALARPDGTNQVDLPLAGLAAGEYRIEFTATTPAGRATDQLAFRVTP